MVRPDEEGIQGPRQYSGSGPVRARPFELTAALAGQDNFKLFKDLQTNGAIIAGANADALNPVLQGAKAAVFGAVDYITLASKAKGESIGRDLPGFRHGYPRRVRP